MHEFTENKRLPIDILISLKLSVSFSTNKATTLSFCLPLWNPNVNPVSLSSSSKITCLWENLQIWMFTDVMLPNAKHVSLHFLCVCVACLPQTAPQTWITILRRTMTATRQSRKPVTTQFMARSVPDYSHVVWMQIHFDINTSDISSTLTLPPLYFRIFMMKTMRSGSPRKPGGKWSEPLRWPGLVASFSATWSFMLANHWLWE